MYFFTAFLSIFFYAITNHLDEKLDKGFGGHPISCTFYTILTSILFIVPFYFLFDIKLPPVESLFFIIPIAIVNIAYLIPYYKAILVSDTSVVVSLFSLSRVFTLFLAFIFLGDTLNSFQIAGFILIVVSCFLLTFDWKKHHSKKVFYYMGICTLIISTESILYKFSLDNVPWYEAFFWSGIFIFCFNLFLLLFSFSRKIIARDFSRYKSTFKIIFFEEFFNFLAAMLYVFALSGISIVFLKAIDSLQPFLVIFIAFIFSRLFKYQFHESFYLKNLKKKLFFFFLTGIGIALVILES